MMGRNAQTFLTVMSVSLLFANDIRAASQNLSVCQRITYDELTKDPKLVLDANKIYFSSRLNPKKSPIVYEVPQEGGITQRPILQSNEYLPMRIADVGTDGASFLGWKSETPDTTSPFFVFRKGKEPASWPGALGHAAKWSPDGRSIAYARANLVLLSGPEKSGILATLSEPGALAQDLHWSPDGKRLRYSRVLPDQSSTIWELAMAGGSPKRVLDHDEKKWIQRAGGWTSDGRVFLYELRDRLTRKSSVWALKEGESNPRQVSPDSCGGIPVSVSSPVPGKSASSFFALVRVYFEKNERLADSMQIQMISLSKDQRWIAYVHPGEGALWRSRLNGGEKLRLSPTRQKIFLPVWAPDGKNIAFLMEDPSTKKVQLHIVGADGKNLRALPNPSSETPLDPTWSPDSQQIAYGQPPGYPPSPNPTISVIDLRQNSNRVLNGSKGFWSPRWSPDGKKLLMLSTEGYSPHLLDLSTGETKQLLSTRVAAPSWSRDGESIFFVTIEGLSNWQELHRLRLGAEESEKLVDFKKASQSGGFFFSGSIGNWGDILPVGNPQLKSLLGAEDIYRFDF